LVQIEVVSFEQIRFNLLDNATKYAPAVGRISLCAHQESEVVVIEMSGEGLGILAAARIFAVGPAPTMPPVGGRS
jgi:K+-sensing histidine kinase KdpD